MTENEATVPAIVWDDIEVLRPGMDYKDGLVYVTIPARLNVIREVGKGKSTKEVVETVDGLAAICSDHTQLRYLPEDVSALGYGYPEHVIIGVDRRWSKDSVQQFLRQEETAPDPVALFGAIRKVYEDYIEFSREEYYDILPLFVFGSYVFRLFKSLGYLHFNGTAASGKSQNLRILEALAFNTAWASSMSSAALYRSLAGHPGTVCIDEAEGWEGERGEELRRILNAGYLDGSTVKRVEKGKNDNFVVASFESYGPKAIASINPLDNVIGSRCLIVGMRPAIRTIREFNKDDERWQRIRDRLYVWLMTEGSSVEALVHDWNENLRFERTPNLLGRQWQITQTYIVLADYLDRLDHGDRVERLYAFFSEYFETQQRQQDAQDRIRLILRVLPEVLRTKMAFDGGWYHIKTIHEVVSAYLEEDAKEYLKTRSVSKHLTTLGFTKRRTHKQGQQVWLDAEAIRSEFRQRRVEPAEEDAAWLRGDEEIEVTEYTAPTPTQDRDDLWAGIAEEDDSAD